jgi:signal peptidase I
MIKIKVETPEKTEKKRDVGVFREYFELISETLIYVFFVMTFLLQSFVIPTSSMEDNILVGDHILVDKVAYSHSLGTLDGFFFPQEKIQRGMIVTFKAPPEMEKEYVKRVIALPGERIKIIDKKIYIDDNPLNESYTYFKSPYTSDSQRDNLPEFTVPENYYFCMGDNRDNSYDSRYWGPVPADNIVGKPWRIYWSIKSTTEEYLTPGENWKEKMKNKSVDIWKTILNFPTKTIWKRTFKKIE